MAGASLQGAVPEPRWDCPLTGKPGKIDLISPAKGSGWRLFISEIGSANLNERIVSTPNVKD